MFSEKVSQNPSKDSEEKPITEEYPGKLKSKSCLASLPYDMLAKMRSREKKAHNPRYLVVFVFA